MVQLDHLMVPARDKVASARQMLTESYALRP
jgi:hypothetical protein